MIVPRRWIRHGRWPTGEVAADAPDFVGPLAYAASVVEAHLRSEHLTADALAAKAGIEPWEVQMLIDGTGVPTLNGLAAIETVIGEQLWR